MVSVGKSCVFREEPDFCRYDGFKKRTTTKTWLYYLLDKLESLRL